MKSGGSIGLDRATSSAHRYGRLNACHRVVDVCTYGCADCCTTFAVVQVVVDVVDMFEELSTVAAQERKTINRRRNGTLQ